MKKLTVICLFCLLTTLATFTSASGDISSYGQPQIDNMIDDAISKTIKSVVQIDPGIKKIAIWNFETGQKDVIDTKLIREKLAIALIKAGNYRRFDVIDQPALEIQAQEHNLTLSKVFDRRKMMKVGEVIGIDGFIYGSIASVDDKVMFNLKLINTDTGSFAWADEIQGEDQVFIKKRQQEQIETQRALKRQTALKRVKSGAKATLESMVLPGLGQFYIEDNSRAVTYLFIEAVSWGVVTQAILAADDNSEDDAVNTRKFIGMGIIALNHLVSAIDAAISTQKHNQKIEEQYNLSLMIYPKKQVKFSYRF